MDPITNKYIVEPTQFKRISEIKPIEGGYSNVYFVERNSEKYVMKETKNSLRDEKQKNSFYQEVTVLSLFHHPAMVPFIGYAVKNNKGKIYLKFMEKGSLDDNIQKNCTNVIDNLWDETHKYIISYGVCRAMKHLHSHNILHRDLKAENVLLDNDLHPYVADFGTSKAVDDARNTLTVKLTTLYIMPPELISNPELNRTKEIDIYSYSMVLYYLWTEERPYDLNENPVSIVRRVLANDRPKFTSNTKLRNIKLQNLITQCWSQDPNKRPTFSHICDLLESNEYQTNIDKQLFNQYKEFIDKEPEAVPVSIPESVLESASSIN